MSSAPVSADAALAPRGGRSLRTFAFALATSLVVSSTAAAQVVINEVLASNRLTNFDEDGDSGDWLELYNAGDAAVSLAGFGVSDDEAETLKWQIPELVLEPGEFATLWCSGKDRIVPAADTISSDSVMFRPEVVGLDAEWSYLTGSPEDGPPPDGWNTLEFDDAAWPTGKPGFGFGDDDDVTILPEDIGAVFLRHRFEIDDPSSLPNLVIQAKVDDGFVAYLNGVRVASFNFDPNETPEFGSRATRSQEARRHNRVDITAFRDVLEPGPNLLAMVLLNQRSTSSDLSLIPELGTIEAPLHTNFNIASEGETVFLSAPDGTIVDQVELPPQVRDQSFGRLTDGTGAFAYFRVPSPSAPNTGQTSDSPMIVADTRFSIDRGFYDEPFEVEITTETPDATIRYTTDGSPPSPTEGTVYDGPVRIERTTPLRAIAYKDGLDSTNIDTQTYIFLDEIVRQDRQATLARGFPARWGGTTADYGMDPRVIGQDGDDRYGGKYAETIRADLLSIPTLSVSLPTDDLFGAQGIYTNSNARGVQWERSASVELIDPSGSEEGFQVNCGLRIHGGAFRSHGLTKKHSLRLLFKGVHGPTKLRYPLFRGTPIEAFDSLVLRANSNDGWQWAAANAQPVYIRDSFGRETALDGGLVASHERFVHVYLNGVYWGLYNFVERPDASFSASYFGGQKEEWDSISNDTASNGSLAAWQQLVALSRGGFRAEESYEAARGNRPDGTDDPTLETYFDAANTIDYMIVNLYVGNSDWPHKNYWIGRRRGPESTGFKFYMWDSEWSLLLRSPLNTNRTTVNNGVAIPYGAARTNPEFQIQFADRLHHYFFNGGPLYVDPQNPTWNPEHPERNRPAERFMRIADSIERAVVAESARWGDQHSGTPYTRDEHWQRERDAIVRGYFPTRSAIVLSQFRGIGLYPNLEAPRFNQHGGRVEKGFSLTIHAPRGDVYYTLDGSDPRLRGGSLNGTATRSEAVENSTVISEGAAAKAFVPTDDSFGRSWTEFEFDDADWVAGTTGVGFEAGTGIEDLIGTDVGEAMLDRQTTVYVRVPFNVENARNVAFLTLSMQFDDGFVAYINGREVARERAPDEPTWDSRAAGSHSASRASEYDISNSIDALREGPNVLAIHGMNVRPTSDDMVVLPRLEISVSLGGGIPIENTMRVKSRALLNGVWSALNEATFIVDESNALRVSELMYHPRRPEEGSSFSDDDFEFLEIQNVGAEEVSLDGVRLAGGIEFEFANGDIPALAPGAFAVVVENRAAFEERYGGGIPVAGQYSGQLSNRGEAIELIGSIGETILEFSYSDAWHAETDGGGRSLTVVDPAASVESWLTRDGWMPSTAIDGSPGAPDESQEERGGLQTPGDADQDGALSIADATTVLSRLFRGIPAELPCDGRSALDGGNAALYDVNGDARFNVTDGIHVLLYLFADGAPPALGTDCVRVEGCPDVCVR